jgi:hypothetical protein
MKRKVIAAVTAFAMLTGMFSESFAASDPVSGTKAQIGTYKDIGGHWAESAIGKWSGYGVISGSQGLFRPDASITRGEMACILDNIMDYQVSAKNTFSDLKDDQFYTDSVLKANAAGIMNGDGVKLRPTDKITREEAAVMLAKAFAVSNGDIAGTKFSDAEEMASWAKASVSGMEAGGYIKGNDGKYNPKANITRAETVAIINNIVKEYYTKAGTYTDKVEGTAVVKASGVVLKGTSISGNLIIAEGVGQGDATLDSVTVKGNTVVRGGGQNSIHIEGTSSLGNIKLEKNGDKLRIVVADGSTVKSMEVADGEEIVITGPVGTVEINASDVKVQAAGAKIANTVISGANSSISLDKESKIGELSINGMADNTEIKTEKGASVGKITAAAKTAVSGKGSIKEVNLNEGAKNSSITTPDTQIKAAAGVTGVTGAGGTAIAAGSTITNNSNGDGVATVQIPVQIPPIPMPSGGGNGGSNGGGNSGGNNNSVTVTGVSAINPITVDNGTTEDKLKLSLPAAVDVNLSNGGHDKANATWNTTSFNGTKTGDITINGTLSVPSGSTWTMTDAQKAVSVKVIVRAAALEVSAVSPVNSRIIEVTLNKSTTAADLAGTAFTAKATTGAAIGIASIDIAPWSDKSVLVTLSADTEQGALYTLTVGTKSFDFGGKSKDTGKPSVTNVTATAANEVTITFNEAIQLYTLKTTISEGYGSKASVAVNSMKYDGSNKIIMSVGDMKDATLYKCIITGITDMAGNQLENNRFETAFVGRDVQKTIIEKNAFAIARSDKDVVVKFDGDIDEANLILSNFTIAEKYGAKTKLRIAEVRFAKTGDKDFYGNIITSETDAKKYAVVKLADDMKTALYNLKFSYIKTYIGVSQPITIEQYTADFAGNTNHGEPFSLNSTNVVADSNTTFSISYKQNLDEMSAKTLANYTLEEANGTKTPLAIKDIVLEGGKLTFTTDSMKSVNYKLTITNLKDSYGNFIKTEDSANIVTVRGVTAEEAAKLITRIESISRNVPSGSTAAFNSDTQIVVDFDNNVGTNATDTNLYTIDGGIGNPTKAEIVDGTGNGDKVILTIGKTTIGASYNLAVKNLLNADGLAIGSDGVRASFAGKGNAYTFPKLQAVIAIDKQTIKVYFDRNVDSSDIKGDSKIWTENGLNAGVFKIKYVSQEDTEYTNFPSNKAWKDPDNANALVIRTNVADKFKYSYSLGGQFVLDGTGALLDADNDNLIFASNDSDVALPQMVAVIAKDARNLTVYFDQAVVINGNANEVFTVGLHEAEDTSGNTEVAVGTGRPVKIDEMTYIVQLNGFLTNSTYYLRVPDLWDIKDKSGYFGLKPKSEWQSYSAVQFGGTSAYAYGSISDVSIMMTDKRTIQVYYPERMDKNDVTTASYYKVYQDSSATIPATGISVPSYVTYDADKNMATLYLNSATIGGSSSSTYYLGIDDSVKNEMGYKNIKPDKTLTGLGTSGILVPFGVNTSDDEKPAIKSVNVDIYNNAKITVEFNEEVSTTAAINLMKTGTADSADDITIFDATWDNADVAIETELFTITNTTSGTAISRPTVQINSIRKISNTKFEIIANENIDWNHSYDIKLTDGGIYNLGGTQAATGDDTQKFVFTAVNNIAKNIDKNRLFRKWTEELF